MTKRTRTTIFILFVFLFILGAPSAVFYSQGYRVDFNAPDGGLKIVQTGGLYFKVAPDRADVYINGKLTKGTSMLTNAAYIENLLPKNYDIEIKKDGYYSWEKTLEVKEKEVTEAENITLFPVSPQFAVIGQAPQKIIASATSTDKEKIIGSNGYEIWITFLKDNPPIGRQGEKIFLTRFSEKIGDIFWLNNYYLIFNVGNKIKITEIDNRGGLNIVDLAEFPKPQITWDKNAKKLYVLSDGKTYLLENLLP
ncbi:MAG: hypothetical protein HYT20_03660 [Candidatus Nealsonbacteria bacterium]|nr:hypothetical protein [Candidatus Nealsonbacteria bacterium]